jgi:hypothetical protein
MIGSRSLLPSAALALLALAFAAMAVTLIPSHLRQDEIDARYQAEHEACDTLNSHMQPLCRQEAKNRRMHAEAEAEYAKEMAKSRREAEREKRIAQYRLDRAYCDTVPNDKKKRCIAEATKRYLRQRQL